jgi:hypothetical protein
MTKLYVIHQLSRDEFLAYDGQHGIFLPIPNRNGAATFRTPAGAQAILDRLPDQVWSNDARIELMPTMHEDTHPQWTHKKHDFS